MKSFGRLKAESNSQDKRREKQNEIMYRYFKITGFGSRIGSCIFVKIGLICLGTRV